MPAVIVLCIAVLAMTASDDEEMAVAIRHAQAQAKAKAQASSSDSPVLGAGIDTPVCEVATELGPDVCNASQVSASIRAQRKTCVKDKLTVQCKYCSNRDKGDRQPCAYKTGAWDPPGGPRQL